MAGPTLATPERLPHTASTAARASGSPSPPAGRPRRVRWPESVAPAAGVWALLYGALGAYWALGGPGFPFGPGTGRGGETPDGSALAGLRVEVGAPAIAVLGPGAAVAAALLARPAAEPRRGAERALLLGFAWGLSALLLLVVPDQRLLAALAYSPNFLAGAPFGWPPVSFFEAVPWPVLNQGVCVAGGVLWAAAALAAQRRTRGACPACGRSDRPPAPWTTPAAAARWGRRAVAVAVAAPLGYTLVRYAWALGFPLGITEAFLRQGQAEGLWRAGAALATVDLVGVLLTLGLGQRWGETFPRWLPGLGGRRVPAVLLPLGDPRLPPAPVAGQAYWDLPAGSRLAYVRIPAAPPAGEPPAPPVVFLHGGPGTPDMAGDAAYFGQLTAGGADVYVYDRAGTGRSARLADPRGYTLTRHVADLEAVREQIGAPQLVLIGHSYGATVAAAYLAAHGARVARAVFSSPDGLPPTDAGGGNLSRRLTLGQRLGVYALLLHPSALLVYALLQRDPRAAHAIAGDAEPDARFDAVYNRSRPAPHCRGAAPGPALHGLGLFAHYVPQTAAGPAPADPRPALAARTTPALVLKGACDYLSWSSAVEYVQALPDARLVYLPGAGHNAYQDRPTAYLAAVRAFLAGRPLPAPPSPAAAPGERPPPDYEGPA